MSTTFGIPREPIDIELGDEDGVYYYINTEIFDKVWFRSRHNSRWLSDLAKLLPDDTRVYALDNSQQGVYTIGDIKKFNEGRTMETAVEMLVRELTAMGIDIPIELVKKSKDREQMLRDMEWQLGYRDGEKSR